MLVRGREPLENPLGAPGVLGSLGGLELDAGDPNMLLIIGKVEPSTASTCEIDVTRDPNGHIIGCPGSLEAGPQGGRTWSA